MPAQRWLTPFFSPSSPSLKMESTATAAHDPVIMPRTSSRNAFTHQASFKSEGSLAEPPMPPRRTDSLAHSRMNSTDSLASTTSTAPETVLTPKSPRRLNKNLISGVENSSLPSSAVPAPGPETNNGTQWSEVAAESARKDVSPVPVPRRNDSAPIVAEPAVEPVDQPASKPDPSPKPVAATKPSPVAVAGTIEPSLHSQEVPSKPRIQVAETPAVASIEAPQSLVTEKQKPTPKDSSLSHVEEDAALMATLREMLPPSPQVASPVSDMVIAVAAVSGAAKPGTSALQALNANLSPIVAQPAQAAAVSVAQRAISGPRTPTSPTSPVLNLGADDALIYSHMIGIEDPEAAERIRMKAQLVQVEPVVENYAGRDLETVDEEEEAQTDPDPDSGSASEPKSCKIYEDEEEDPRFPRKNTEHSPFGHSQSMEELDSERDYSGPIISGLPRSSSTPRLDAIRGVGRLSTYQPSVSSPLAGGRAPRKRRKSFRGNRPTAYGTARHSMVGLTPENMEELKKDAHAAIRDMLLRSVEEDQMKERKRQSKLRQSTVPTDDYASFSRPESYYPDDTASQISEGDRSSNFAPSMRTSRTAPDLNSRSPPKSSAFRMARDDHRASMMALDNLMRNDNNYGDSDDAFELGSMSSDLHGDMHGDYDDDDMEDGSSGRGSSMPLGDNLFDSDILSLDQAEKALKYARRTQDVDERVRLRGKHI